MDPRDHGARLWDALITTAQHALATEVVPDSHGARPRVTVTTSLEVLRGQIDWATLGSAASLTEDGLDLTPATIRRLACDADIIPVALGGRGEVLDVGRTHRLVTQPMWRALVCRDQHCAFPGCTRPPVMCHAHHIVHWAHGGTTKLANLVLLCGHHHRTIHHTPWEVRINPRTETRVPPTTPPRTPTTRLDQTPTTPRVSRDRVDTRRSCSGDAQRRAASSWAASASRTSVCSMPRRLRSGKPARRMIAAPIAL